MKFGVLQFFSWPGRRAALTEVYRRAMDRICIMDETGYDAVWLAEHHFTDYSVCPSVHMIGVQVAERTSRLRIGTAVSLAPFYHPLRLAEEVALLDQLSGGRVSWGAGRGFDPDEFRTFGVPMEESRARFQEAVEIVLAAWRNERLDWDGEYWRFEDVEVLPKPAQQPHPPVWAACGSPDAAAWAGRAGLAPLLGPHATFEGLNGIRGTWRQARDDAGHPASGQDIPTARLLAVADSDDEAAEIVRRGAAWIVATYKNESKGTANPTELVLADGTVEAVDPVERYLDNVAIWGSPARVADELSRLREEIDLHYLMCAPLSHSSFLGFTEKVLPKFL